MPSTEQLLAEFDQEMARTRRILADIPPEKMDWQAAEGLRTVGWNANHITDIVGWTESIVMHDGFDIHPPGEEPYETSTVVDPTELIQHFDEAVAHARSVIQNASDDDMAGSWSLRNQGKTMFTINRSDCLRTFMMNHIIHHRAILSVYLRMAGVDSAPVYSV